MSEPTTAAGRALLNDFMAGSGMLNRQPPRGSVAEQILAIEAEARQQDDSALREALEKIESIEAGLVEAQAIADELVRRDVERAALPPSAPPPLDVEVLRTALLVLFPEMPSNASSRRSYAEMVAAEYARLQELDHD